MPNEATVVETWEHKLENRAANDGYGMCNTSSCQHCVCMFGGHGCNVDHRFVKLLGADMDVRRLRLQPGDKVVVRTDGLSDALRQTVIDTVKPLFPDNVVLVLDKSMDLTVLDAVGPTTVPVDVLR